MNFIDSYRQEIDSETALEIMPELKEDYLQDRPCKWEEGKIQLWKVASALIEDCDPSIEKHSFLCTPVFFDKTGEHRYFRLYEKTMQEQIAEFDQQVGVIHELDCTITDKHDNTEAKIWLLQLETKINHG